MLKIKFSLLVLLLIVGCSDRKPPSNVAEESESKKEIMRPAEGMLDYEWMIGTWLAHGLEYYEVWERTDDSTMFATVYKELGVDSTISEVVRFEYRDGRYNYIPTVRSQNSGQPILFKSVQANKDMIQFENMAHDFPNRIVYFNTSDQQLDVKIEGVSNGQIYQSYDIMMSRLEE